MTGKLLAELAWLMWIEAGHSRSRIDQGRLATASCELALRARRAGFRGTSRREAFQPEVGGGGVEPPRVRRMPSA